MRQGLYALMGSLGWIVVWGLLPSMVSCDADDCSTGNDCDRGEVCFFGACEPAPGLTCQSDLDCRGGMDVASSFFCQAGICVSDAFRLDTGTSTQADAGSAD